MCVMTGPGLSSSQVMWPVTPCLTWTWRDKQNYYLLSFLTILIHRLYISWSQLSSIFWIQVVGTDNWYLLPVSHYRVWGELLTTITPHLQAAPLCRSSAGLRWGSWRKQDKDDSWWVLLRCIVTLLHHRPCVPSPGLVTPSPRTQWHPLYRVACHVSSVCHPVTGGQHNVTISSGETVSETVEIHLTGLHSF